jgi:hypothetical protein
MFAGLGNKVFQSSLNKGGGYANNVISSVAHGSIAQTGSITGDKAATALQSYMNVGGKTDNISASSQTDGDSVSVQNTADNSTPIPQSPTNITNESSAPNIPSSHTEVENDNYSATTIPQSSAEPSGVADSIPASPVSIDNSDSSTVSVHSVENLTSTISGGAPSVTPSSVPTTVTNSIPTADNNSVPNVTAEQNSESVKYSEVEIGGGRITGYETPVSGGETRQFAMYSTEQYLKPESKYETVTAIDDSKWYKQYAQAAVEKTPYSAPDGSVKYSEKIVQKIPPMPRRKDRV